MWAVSETSDSLVIRNLNCRILHFRCVPPSRLPDCVSRLSEVRAPSLVLFVPLPAYYPVCIYPVQMEQRPQHCGSLGTAVHTFVLKTAVWFKVKLPA